MESLSRIDLRISSKLKDRGYRHRFFKRRAQDEIASQIRELRITRGLKQKDLALAMDTGQSAVARIEDATYSGWSFATLQKVAETLDARLKVVFEPMENVIRDYERREAREQNIPDALAFTVRAFQEIATTPEQANRNMQELVRSLGAVPMAGKIMLAEAAVLFARDASQAKTGTINENFKRRSHETEINPAFSGG